MENSVTPRVTVWAAGRYFQKADAGLRRLIMPVGLRQPPGSRADPLQAIGFQVI
jgi:hypothetical protein